MQDFQTSLKFLGLSSDETKIYLACLKFGEQSIANIARITKIGRVNSYHHAEKLVKKGLLLASKKNKIKTFIAENPKIFINRETEKLNLAREIVPELLAIASKSPQKPRIQFFDGSENLKKIFEKTAEIRCGEIVSFSNFENLRKFFDKNFLKNHFADRLAHGTKTRFISPRTPTSENFIAENFPENFDEKLLEVFLISPEEFHFESEITIFAGSIAILNLNLENPVGVLIENPELFRTQKAVFDLAWLGATSFITR